MNLEAVTEGLLFVVGDDGLTLNQLMDILEVDSNQVKDIISSLQRKYDKEDRGIRIKFLGNTFKFTTKKEHKDYFKKLIENPESNVLSQAALETLAIVAYNQPLTRIEVDEIRGVGSQQMMRKLVAKGFIKETGRSDTLGRPILYKTTSDFLDYFGLSTIDDLPKFEDFIQDEVNEEADLYESKYQEVEIKEN